MLKPLVAALTAASISLPLQAATADQIADLQAQLDKLKASLPEAEQSDSSLALYGSLRPSFTISDTGSQSESDVTDALSRFGFRGATELAEQKVFFTAEWSIPINNSAELERSRQVYVGIAGDYGQFKLGKQRPVQYSLIAEPVDIFNHSLSPYAYDSAGSPFFIDNTLSYQLQKDAFNFQLALQANGDSGDNHSDLINAGVSYSAENLYLATSFLQLTRPSGGNTSVAGDEEQTFAFAASYQLEDCYLALAVQLIENEPGGGGADEETTTFDLSMAKALNDRDKVKFGVFNLSDDRANNSREFSGVNVTLERQLASHIRVHSELLVREPNSGDTQYELAFGIRYDFERELF